MKMFVILARCALIIFCLPRRCDGCLDVLLRSFFQVFNPSVEVGPDRLVSRHRYADGIMPDYPDTAPGYDGGGGGGGGGVAGGRRVGRLAAGAGHEDGPAVSDGRRRRARGGPTDAAAGERTAEGRPPRTRPRGGNGGDFSLGSLTDFIASLIETVQLTSRATLKRSRSGADAVTTTAAPTTTVPVRRRPRRSRPAPAVLAVAGFADPSELEDV